MTYRFFAVAWLLGIPGVIAVAVLVLPNIVADRPMSMPLWVAQIASVAQGGLLLALAVLSGMMFAPEVRLIAPVLSAIAGGKPPAVAIRPLLVPGLVGALAGAAILWGVARFAPTTLAELQARASVPVAVRLLYGGVTEELLVRWGVMTVLVWAAWKTIQRGAGEPSWLVVGIGIVLSAVMFGAVHLPAAFSLMQDIPLLVAVWIVVANSAFGVVTGWLYWRYGLEAAILAHTGAHAIILMTTG